MADDILLQINLNRATNFEFELSVTGISADSAKVTFGLEVTGLFTIQFPCVRGDDGNWSVSIPVLDKYMEEGNYTYTIELIVEGYHFSPVKGTAHVGPVAEVKGSMPKKKVSVSFGGLKSTDKPDNKEEKAEEKVVKKAEKKEEKKAKKAEKVEEKKKPGKGFDTSKSI
ncbi:hypothetical protein LCGC14_1763140, partial [marine sediment metagenome]